MHYGKILTISLTTIALAGCAVTNPSPESVAKRNSAADAPPLVSSGQVASRTTDVNATYSRAASGDGMMNQTSVSMPIQETSSTVPHIDNTAQVAVAQPVAQPIAKPVPRATTPAASLGGGFTVNMAYADAWPKTGKALPSAGYPVMEKDDMTGTYYVLDKVGSGGKIERDTPIYQVRLTKNGNTSTRVILLNSSSGSAPSDVANRILGALKSKLD